MMTCLRVAQKLLCLALESAVFFFSSSSRLEPRVAWWIRFRNLISPGWSQRPERLGVSGSRIKQERPMATDAIPSMMNCRSGLDKMGNE